MVPRTRGIIGFFYWYGLPFQSRSTDVDAPIVLDTSHSLLACRPLPAPAPRMLPVSSERSP